MLHNPLVGSPPTEVPLAGAPLVRVIVQVRFPLIASVEKQDFVGPFQEAIRREYPVMRQELGSFVSQAGGVIRPHPIWRFSDLEHRWRVSLASDFLALDTARYSDRSELLARFGRLLLALEAHVAPGAIDRLGVRYTDRVMGEQLRQIDRLVRPELVGALVPPLSAHTRASVSESVFSLPEERGELRARWGLVPSGVTLDADAIDPVEEPSWVLDIDVYRGGERPFVVADLQGETRALTERVYAFFRWAVTDEFLAAFGRAR